MIRGVIRDMIRNVMREKPPVPNRRAERRSRAGGRVGGARKCRRSAGLLPLATDTIWSVIRDVIREAEGRACCHWRCW